MIKLHWRENGATHRTDDTAALPGLIEKQVFFWMDVEAESEERIEQLLSPLGFHQLAIEDAARPHQRPKVDEFEGFFFLVTHEVDYSPDVEEDEGVQSRQISAFVRENALVTVHSEPIKSLAELHDRCANRDVITRGADFFLYHLLDTLVDRYFPILEELDDRIDTLEDQIVRSPRQDLLDEIFTLKRSLIHLRKLAGPSREMLTMLTTRNFPGIRDESMPYFRDVSDHLIRIYEILDSYRDLMSGALDAYLSNISNQLNLVMQRLTIVTVIFLPLTFVTGIFGMNFKVQPWTPDWDHGQIFWMVMAGMTLLGIVLAWWFHRKRLL